MELLYHRIIEKSPTYYPMANFKERRAMKIGQLTYSVVKEISAPAANKLLVRYKLLSAFDRHMDMQKTMLIIKTHKRANRRFLGPFMTFDKLQLVSKTRP